MSALRLAGPVPPTDDRSALAAAKILEHRAGRAGEVKPEFFTSLPVASVSIGARLTFVGLWTYCDDDGRAVYEPRLLKAALWPLDDAITVGSVADHVRELIQAGLVFLYEARGRRYIAVKSFAEHQKVEKKRPSKLPPPPPREVGESSGNRRGEVGERSPLEGKGEEWRGEEEEGRPPPPAGTVGDDAPTPLLARILGKMPEEFRPDMAAFLRSCTDPDGWAGAIEGAVEGAEAQAGTTWADAGKAVRDYRLNGRPPNARSWRRYLDQARAERLEAEQAGFVMAEADDCVERPHRRRSDGGWEVRRPSGQWEPVPYRVGAE
jgi:hypothetical protein